MEPDRFNKSYICMDTNGSLEIWSDSDQYWGYWHVEFENYSPMWMKDDGDLVTRIDTNRGPVHYGREILGEL